MKKSLLTISIWVISLTGTDLFAQFVNLGDFYVKDGGLLWSQFSFENRNPGKFINDGTAVFLSDVINDGDFGFSPLLNTGLVRLEGPVRQSLTGSRELNFWNLQLDNDSGFSLGTSSNSFGEVNFQNGIVAATSANSIFGFGLGGNSINSSDASFVDGKVGGEAGSEFLFPTGDDFYRRFLLASPVQGGENLKLNARYFLEDPGNQFPRDLTARNVLLVDDAEYWELENLTAADSELILTLSWRDVTTPPFILGEINRLGIVRWNEDSGLWVSEGGVVDFDEQLVTSQVLLSETGVFTLGILTGFTNLGLTKTSFDRSVWEGDEFDYEIKLQNNSTVAASDVVLVDNLPLGLEFVNVTGESIFGLLDFKVEVIGQSVIIRIPEFIGGDEATFTLRVRASVPGKIINIAEVNSFEPDEDLEDNVALDENEVKSFFIPNVITPNNDTFNDRFEIKGLNKFQSNKLSIINRWGDLIFEKGNYQNDWSADGLISGTYFYVLEVVEDSGETKSFKGWIQVIKEN